MVELQGSHGFCGAKEALKAWCSQDVSPQEQILISLNQSQAFRSLCRLLETVRGCDLRAMCSP